LSFFSNSQQECAGARSLCRGREQPFGLITGETHARRYGIELDSFRAVEAGRLLDEAVQGSVFDTHCPVESYSLLYLNPPYDDEGSRKRAQPANGGSVFWSTAFRMAAGPGRSSRAWSSPATASRAVSDVLAPHFPRFLESIGSRIRRRLEYSQIAAFRNPPNPARKGSDCMTVTYPPLGRSSPTIGPKLRAPIAVGG